MSDCADSGYHYAVIGFIMLQEFGSVFFNLICNSRLSNQDYYYGVNATAASGYDIGSDPIFASSASFSSMFVLLLTLIVFNAPFLNTWLVAVDYKCVEDGFNKKRWYTLGGIIAAHTAAVVLAFWIIDGVRNDWQSSITWPDIKKEAKLQQDNYFWAVMFEELFAVASLLVGFLYLAWLRPRPSMSATPILDIQFCISLTLLVAATGRAFPTAHLSPHVSTYKWISREITFWPWFWHMLGGLVASGLVLFWNTRRIEFHEEQNKALAPPTYTKGGALDGAFAFSKETPRGMMPPASLSISFAKGGGVLLARDELLNENVLSLLHTN